MDSKEDVEMKEEVKIAEQTDENEPCVCYICSVSANDSIRMKRGDDEQTASVVMKTWNDRPLSKELNFRLENSTLGNLLADRVARDPRIRCAAQKIEHPTDTNVKILVDVIETSQLQQLKHQEQEQKQEQEQAELSTDFKNRLSVSNKAALICIEVIQNSANQAIEELLGLERQLMLK